MTIKESAGWLNVTVLREVSDETALDPAARVGSRARAESTLRLRPCTWQGEGLLGMRIVQVAAPTSQVAH